MSNNKDTLKSYSNAVNYHTLLAHMSAGVTNVFDVIGYQLNFECRLYQKIWKILFLLPVVICELALGIVLFILALIGKIILIIPLINFVFVFVFEIIHFIGFVIGLIGNLLGAKKYVLFFKEAYIDEFYNAQYNY